MGWLARINAVWQRVGVVQRALLLAIVLACVITGGLLTKWASSADMRLLYRGLSPEEAGEIVDKISESKVPYELRGDGTSIYVPEDQVYRLRLAMAKEGLPSGGKQGYEIFDNEKIGVSPLVQQLNKQRAMQDELARTITLIDGVEAARVHIVRPEQTGILATDEEEVTASVMLVVKPGWSIGQPSVAAITHLVASATEGLKPENVTVADGHGLLTSHGSDNGIVAGANTYKDYKRSIEEEMNRQIRDALERFLGPGRVSITSNVMLDMTHQTVVQTTYDKGVAEEETIDSTEMVKEASLDADGQPVSPNTKDKTETITNKYKIPETITTTSDVPGKIVSWSIAAIVDLHKPKMETVDAKEPAAENAPGAPATPATPAGDLIMSLEDVREVIINAIGGDKMLATPDSLTVKNIPVYRPPVALDGEAGGYEKLSRYIEIARHSSIGVLAVCALLVLRIFTRAGKKAAAPSASGSAGIGQLDAGSMGLLPAAAGGGSPVQLYRQQIAAQLQQNPEQVKKLFTSWLAEGH